LQTKNHDFFGRDQEVFTEAQTGVRGNNENGLQKKPAKKLQTWTEGKHGKGLKLRAQPNSRRTGKERGER